MKKSWKIIYLALALCMMALPLYGLVLPHPEEVSTENRTLASWPQALDEDNHLNLEYLGEAGKWFEDHFAFRSAYVNAQSVLLSDLFHTSGSDQVILGKKDWLFYEGTLNDYQGFDLLSEREIQNIVHNLDLMNYYCQSQNSRLVLAIAPNKNELYEEYMPDRYNKSDESNLKNLQAALENSGIIYIDLLEGLQQEKEQSEYDLYYPQDTHWNHAGALAAYNSLMDEMGLAHETYERMSPEITETDPGDLAEMLYPTSAENQEDYIWLTDDYVWKQGEEDLMADLIETGNDAGNDTLLMFRDSFAKALIPYLSSQYQSAFYDRQTPYNLIRIEALGPSDVIIERTQRRLSSLQESAALIRMPVVSNFHIDDLVNKNTAALDMQADGDFIKVSGLIDPASLNINTSIYVQLERSDGQVYTYPMFYTAGEDHAGNGFEAYLEKAAFANENTLSVLLYEDGTITLAAMQDFSLQDPAAE